MGDDVRRLVAAADRLVRGHDRLVRATAESVGVDPVGAGQARVLMALIAAPRSQVQVARELGVDQSVVAVAVAGLRERSLVVSRPDTRDRRARVASLTDDGRHLAVQLSRELARVEGRVRRAVGDAEVTSALEALSVLADDVERRAAR